MNAIELMEGLEKTGTGDRFLRPIKELVLENRDASADQAIAALRQAADSVINTPITHEAPGGHKSRAESPTISKAVRLLRGEKPEDINGKPPPTVESQTFKGMAEALHRMVEQQMKQKQEEMQAWADSKGIGHPDPSMVRKEIKQGSRVG